jgi:hypothetical protein
VTVSVLRLKSKYPDVIFIFQPNSVQLSRWYSVFRFSKVTIVCDSERRGVVVNLKRRLVQIPVGVPDNLISLFFAVSPCEYSNKSRPSSESFGFDSRVLLGSFFSGI